jgi:hypothetical protein
MFTQSNIVDHALREASGCSLPKKRITALELETSRVAMIPGQLIEDDLQQQIWDLRPLWMLEARDTHAQFGFITAEATAADRRLTADVFRAPRNTAIQYPQASSISFIWFELHIVSLFNAYIWFVSISLCHGCHLSSHWSCQFWISDLGSIDMTRVNGI